MPGYIPRRDNEFLIWINTFNTWAQANGAANGLNPSQLGDLNIFLTTYASLIN